MVWAFSLDSSIRALDDLVTEKYPTISRGTSTDSKPVVSSLN